MKLTGAPLPTSSTQNAASNAVATATTGIGRSSRSFISCADGMIALSSDSADGKQQVVVIDTKSHVMSVYHIDHAGGMISLKSVRNITADFTLDEFNTGSPSPQDIRAMKNGRERI